jgi:hypothetical protein
MNGGIVRTRSRAVIMLSVAGLTGILAACNTAQQTASTVGTTTTAPSTTTTTTTPAETYFTATGYGELQPGTTEAEAVASREIGAAPVDVIGCREYAYPDGPQPDPAQMAADAKLEAQYLKATAEVDTWSEKHPPERSGARQNAEGAQKAADAAGLAAKSAQRMVERLQVFLGSGGASFGHGRLRSLVAPPGAHTAEGIGRGSTEQDLRAAYPSLTDDGEGRWSMPSPGNPGWTFAVDVESGKVKQLLLSTDTVTC